MTKGKAFITNFIIGAIATAIALIILPPQFGLAIAVIPNALIGGAVFALIQLLHRTLK